MVQPIMPALIFCCIVSAFLSGGLAAFQALANYDRRRVHAKAQVTIGMVDAETRLEVSGVQERTVRYLMRLSQALELNLTRRWFSRLPLFGLSWYSENASVLGLSDQLSAEAYCEGRLRLALVFMLAGIVLGAIVSDALMVMGVVIGLMAGFLLPKRSLEEQRDARLAQLEKELPEFLEVMALGLRSGLSFDRGFSLYCQHFDTGFSQSCKAAQNEWTLGLKTREQSLRDLSESYDSPLLKRVVEVMVRSLRFGSSLAVELEQAAAEARGLRRAHRQEEVAKAPIKMMIPTGTLILPAMLLLVLGPVLLEMSGGFV